MPIYGTLLVLDRAGCLELVMARVTNAVDKVCPKCGEHYIVKMDGPWPAHECPLEVELPVCPVCYRISLVATASFNGKTMCVGPRGALHKQTRMLKRKFREVR